MARKKWSSAILFRKVLFFLLAALLTGFLTVFLAKLLGRYIHPHFAVSLAVGLAVFLTLWLSQLMKNPPFIIGRTSPLIAGVCAGLGVHIARVWLT